MSAPQVLPASFFWRHSFLKDIAATGSFLKDIAATASRCVFYVRRVCTLAPRKVGLSACGTDMSSSFSITFTFTVESEKSVVCVLLQVISMHHSFAQNLTLLMLYCMACVAFGGVFGRSLSSKVISVYGICDSRWEDVDNVI